MPKLKTKSGVKKRFKVTKSGKVKSGSAFTSHMMQNKPKSAKRKLRGTSLLCKADAIKVLSWMPYNRKKKTTKKTQGDA